MRHSVQAQGPRGLCRVLNLYVQGRFPEAAKDEAHGHPLRHCDAQLRAAGAAGGARRDGESMCNLPSRDVSWVKESRKSSTTSIFVENDLAHGSLEAFPGSFLPLLLGSWLHALLEKPTGTAVINWVQQSHSMTTQCSVTEDIQRYAVIPPSQAALKPDAVTIQLVMTATPTGAVSAVVTLRQKPLSLATLPVLHASQEFMMSQPVVQGECVLPTSSAA